MDVLVGLAVLLSFCLLLRWVSYLGHLGLLYLGLLNLQFNPLAPDMAYVTDITYIRTGAGLVVHSDFSAY